MKKIIRCPLSLSLIGLIVLMNICRNFLWLVPSSLMSPMMVELVMDYTQAGMLVTIVTVVMGVFLVGGSFLLNYIPPLLSMVLGLGVLAVGGLGSCLSQSYGILLFFRVLVGTGYGLAQCATAALFASFFSSDQLGIVNGLNLCINALSISLGYALIAPIYELLGNSWRAETMVLVLLCVGTMVLFLLWYVPAKKRLSVVREEQRKAGIVRNALGFPLIRKMILMYAFIMPVYITFSSYYPNYLHEILHYTLEGAGNLVSIMSVSGMVGSLLMGSAFQAVHSPKRVFLLLFVLFCLGFVGMVLLHGTLGLIVAISMFGGSYNALLTMCCTIVMTQEGILPLVGSAGASMLGVIGSLISVFSPTAVQFLSEQIQLSGALLAFGMLLLPACLLVADIWRVLPVRKKV